MSKELHITDEETNDIQTSGDQFPIGSIVLVKLNKLPDNFKINNYIKPENCSREEEYVIKNRKDVFNSIYNVGKNIYKLLEDDIFNSERKEMFLFSVESSEENYSKANLNDRKKIIKLKNIYNEYIKENGWPFFIGDMKYFKEKTYNLTPRYFLNECLNVYTIEELRKWIFKINQKIKENTTDDKKEKNYFNFSTRKLMDLYAIHKNLLIMTTKSYPDTLINDGLSSDEIVNTLEHGIPNNTNKKLSQKEIDCYKNFLKTLQRALMCLILRVMEFSGHAEQYLVSNRLPIYNSQNEQYRLYTLAHSLIGIAYDYLLFNLSATKTNSERVICKFPNCNNEFEKYTSSPYCGLHNPDEIRAYTQHKYYMKNKDKRKKKK